MLDAVIMPSRRLVRGTDVPGRVALRQGGSAASCARWLARLGSIAGWVGAPLALAIGIIQKSNGVSGAFVDALFVGTCALVAGTLNEAAHRLAQRAATPP